MKRLTFLVAMLALLGAACSFSVGTVHFGATETPTPTLTPTSTPTPTPTLTPTPTKVLVPGIDRTLIEYGLGLRFTNAYFTTSYDADLGDGLKTYHPAVGTRYLVVTAAISGDFSSLIKYDPWKTDLWVTNEFGDKFIWGNFFILPDGYHIDWLWVLPDTNSWRNNIVLNFKDGTKVDISHLFR